MLTKSSSRIWGSYSRTIYDWPTIFGPLPSMITQPCMNFSTLTWWLYYNRISHPCRTIQHIIAVLSSPRRAAHHSLPQIPRPPVNDETHFFDRVKPVLDTCDLYNEFLKLVNLFAQDYIDTARLVKESRNFLGNTKLYQQFWDIVGWDDKEREHQVDFHVPRPYTSPDQCYGTKTDRNFPADFHTPLLHPEHRWI